MKNSIRTKFLVAGVLPMFLTTVTLALLASRMTGQGKMLMLPILIALSGIGLSLLLAVTFERTIRRAHQADLAQAAAALQAVQATSAQTLQEIRRVTQAVNAGQLDAHGRADGLDGLGRDFITEFNRLSGAFDAPFKMLAESIDRLSKGEIPAQLTQAYRGEFQQITQNLNLMIRKLADFAAKIQAAAEQVRSESNTAHLISVKMSEEVAAQAASTEEASAALEQMAATIRQNAENALKTEKLALTAAEQAQAGEKAVGQAVAAMHLIARKTSIIQGIALQTRMLSLNATIEAAKAQEHGKSFAVVAAEVRKLSDITKAAAEEISKLTSASVAIVEAAGAILGQLTPSIRQTAEFVQEIRIANNEQRLGMEQMNFAMQQLDAVAQENALKAEELASTAAGLAQQAEQLQKVSLFFRVAGAELETVYDYALAQHEQEWTQCAAHTPEIFARTNYRIGFVFEGMFHPHLVAIKEDVEAVAAQYRNIRLEVLSAETDINKQMADLQKLVSQKVDALLIQSANPQMLIDTLTQADALGIPYFFCLKGMRGTQAVSQALAAYSLEGKVAGEFIAQELKDGGNVVIIEGIPGDESSIARCGQIRQALQTNPRIKILASRPGYYQQEPARKVMQDFLKEFPQIDFVYGANDLNALGAVEAIRAAGKLGKIKVVGTDAARIALESIKKGEMHATLTHGSGGARGRTLGAVGMQFIADYLQGRSIPRWFVSEAHLVTRENVAAIQPLF